MAASCEDSFEPAKPQENPQQPIMKVGDIEVAKAGVLASDQTINLNTYNDPDNYTVTVLAVTKEEDVPTGASVKLELQVSKTADFASYGVVELTRISDSNLYEADAYAWSDVQAQVFGNSIKPQTAYYRVPVFINLNETDYRYDNPNYYAVTGTMSVMKMEPSYQITDNYYVFGPYIGGNTPATGVAMTHDERDVYDNPNFSFAFQVTEEQAGGKFTLLIAPEDVHNAGGAASLCYGMGEEEGTLAIGGDPIVVSEEGPYMLEVDMYNLTYVLKVAPASLYVMSTASPGNAFANVAQLGTSDYVTYEGCAGILTSWGLTGQAAYKPTMYVLNPDVERTQAENGTYTGGIMQDTSGAPLNANIAIPRPGNADGMYYITANLATLTYTGYQVKNMGLVGSINNWGNENPDGSVTPDVALKTSRTTLYMTWTGQLTVAAGDEWKIRANSEWVVDFGGANGGDYATDGSDVELAKGGANFVAAEAGTYDVTVYLRRVVENGKMTPYYMTVTPAK